MNINSILFALGCVAMVGATQVSAASPEHMQEVASMVTDESVPALLRETYYFASGEQNGSQAVFLCDGKRYTLYHSGEHIVPDDSQSVWLAFWVRQDGTYGQESLDTFSDSGFDGVVDFGVDGLRQRVFRSDGDYVTGDEHREYWQQQLDAAVDALLQCKSR